MENTMISEESLKSMKEKAWDAGYANGYLAGRRQVHGGFIMALDAEFDDAHSQWAPRPGWHQIDVLEHCRKLAKHAIKTRITEITS